MATPKGEEPDAEEELPSSFDKLLLEVTTPEGENPLDPEEPPAYEKLVAPEETVYEETLAAEEPAHEEPKDSPSQDSLPETSVSDLTNLDPKTFPEIHVMVAGLPRTGKSTALNNIFDLKLKAKRSPRSVTTQVLCEHKVVTENKIVFKVIDTPGLRANDVNEEVVLYEMKKIGIEKGFLLIVTCVVHPSSAALLDFHNTLKNLTTIFGVDVWNWSIVLLTHSDKLQEEEEDDDEDSDDEKVGYDVYLRECCKQIEEILRKNGVKKRIKLFMEYSNLDQLKQEENDIIIALPASKKCTIEMTKLLLPSQPWTHQYSWADLAYMGIMKINTGVPQAGWKRWALIELRYGKYVLGSGKTALKYSGATGGTVGCVAGAIKGGLVGAPAGLPGVLVGIAVGGVLGAVAGVVPSVGAASAGVAACHYGSIYRDKKRRKKTHEEKEEGKKKKE